MNKRTVISFAGAALMLMLGYVIYRSNEPIAIFLLCCAANCVWAPTNEAEGPTT